jgi:hypothetical protein
MNGSSPAVVIRVERVEGGRDNGDHASAAVRR